MKYMAFAAVVITLSLLGSAREGQAAVGVSGEPARVQMFHDALAPYGAWMRVAPHGTVWVPYGTEVEWRPYTNGHWLWTAHGWTWHSKWAWGWAPFHYGRWSYTDKIGWYWVPDTTWGPAWVAWRGNDEWSAWAPLPPAARYDATRQTVNADAVVDSIPLHAWVIVPVDQTVGWYIGPYMAGIERAPALLANTTHVTRYSARHGRPYCEGVPTDRIERELQEPLPVHTIVEARTADDAARSWPTPYEVVVYRPGAGEAVTASGIDAPGAALPDADIRSAWSVRMAAARARMDERQRHEVARADEGPTPDELRVVHAEEAKVRAADERRLSALLDKWLATESQGRAPAGRWR